MTISRATLIMTIRRCDTKHYDSRYTRDLVLLCISDLSQQTNDATTLRIMTLSRMTKCIATLSMTIRKCDTQHYDSKPTDSRDLVLLCISDLPQQTNDATTLSIMTLSRMTISIATLSMTIRKCDNQHYDSKHTDSRDLVLLCISDLPEQTNDATTLWIMTLRRMTISIATLSMTIRKCDTKHYDSRYTDSRDLVLLCRVSYIASIVY
jgi:hypothetical protein